VTDDARPFTICCLLYGDYPEMARRLLQSLYEQEKYGYFDLRVGVNNVSAATEQVILDYSTRMPLEVALGESPYYKYPLMRHLFYHKPIETPMIMWFDDDSWIQTSDEGWFPKVWDAMGKVDMIGSIWNMHLQGNQRQFIEDQPWYTGKDIPSQISFCTGGWWTIDTKLIYRHNWPMHGLEHRGGDVMLGHLCHQQGYKIEPFTLHLAINADNTGKCSSSPRRGFDQKPIGFSYQRRPRSDTAPDNKDWTDILAGE